MSNFEALHPRTGGTGANRTQFTSKPHSDQGLPTLGWSATSLSVAMRGEQAVVMHVAPEETISLADELAKPRRDRPLDPIFHMKERPGQMDEEAFERELQEAAQEYNANARPATTGERPWTPPPTYVEAPVSLADELPKRDFNSTREPQFRMKERPGQMGQGTTGPGGQWNPPPTHVEPSISFADELPKRDFNSTREPQFRMKERPEPMDEETFKRELQEAAQEFNANARPATTGERPWTPPPTHVEPSISLIDELAKPRRATLRDMFRPR